MPHPRSDSTYLQTLASGLEVLNLLGRHPFLTLVEVGERLGFNPSKTYRLLSTLESERYVARTPGKSYHLGPAAVALGFAAHRHHPLVAQARDVLDWLVEETAESSYLVIRNGHARVVLDMRDAPQRLRTFAPVGEDHPLHVSGAGLTLLAFSPAAVVDAVLSEELCAVTPATETDPARVRRLLDEIRQRGYHVAKEDFKVNAFSVGSPVFDRAGDLQAVVAVAGPMSRLDDDRETVIVERVTEAAMELSARHGYPGPGRR